MLDEILNEPTLYGTASAGSSNYGEKEQSQIKSILDGLEAPYTFPSIDLEPCKRANSLRRVQAVPGVKHFSQMMKDAGLPAQVGFNMGSGDINFTFMLPESDKMYNKKDQRQLIVWMMLGLMPNQLELEKLYTEEFEGGERGDKLANRCLQQFSAQTGVSITDKLIDYFHVNCRITVCPAEDTESVSSGRTPLVYSPIYEFLTGFHQIYGCYSEEVLVMQKSSIIQDLVMDFWEIMEKKRYMPDSTLKENLSNALVRYFDSGIQGQVQGFLPVQEHLSLYLHGTAGIGKSSFVKTFCSSLEELLRKHLDPEKIVRIVKVPFNSITPQNLRSILHVRGISDLSIERILEQTLCKGGIVVFHLEENPEDPSLQNELFMRTKEMLNTLLGRYQEFASNVVIIFTSNYGPSEMISKESRELLMKAPSHERQREWCSRKLEDRITEVTNLGTVSVELTAEIPSTVDLRPLEQWWMSVAFHISRHLQIHMETITDRVTEKVSIVVAGNTKLLSIDFNHGFPTLALESHNSFFFFRPETRENQSLLEKGLPLMTHANVNTLTEMLHTNYLKPCVIVLIGESEKREKYEKILLSHFTESFGEKLHSTEVSIHGEEDKHKVFGQPHEIQGGLFKFIASVNNPNACGGREDLIASVFARVNELGQFILRELLENGSSSTHRQAVHKDRLVFVLSITDTCEITPQLQSRAHTIIECV